MKADRRRRLDRPPATYICREAQPNIQGHATDRESHRQTDRETEGQTEEHLDYYCTRRSYILAPERERCSRTSTGIRISTANDRMQRLLGYRTTTQGTDYVRVCHKHRHGNAAWSTCDKCDTVVDQQIIDIGCRLKGRAYRNTGTRTKPDRHAINL